MINPSFKEYLPSYYVSTANPHPSYPTLEGRLKTELTPNIKQNLIKTLHCQISIERQHFSTLAAIDKMISSFQASVTDKNAKQLKLPEILPLKEYQYE